ncbi:helix-turn-helix transcriptional regulator [Primorskyibacter sp. S87]|uniref:helix-turn-helix transcriptional regulator n=1 Tax=Primorskyibacter sp. S87 TaxID=3415126 RepID=UPI003C7DBE33
MTEIELSNELSALREKVDLVADQLTRIGVGPKLMTTPECAEFLGFGKDIIFEWRKKGIGPPYLSITERTLRYDRDAVFQWARSHEVK